MVLGQLFSWVNGGICVCVSRCLYMQFSLVCVQMCVQDQALCGWPASKGPSVCVAVSVKERERIWLCMLHSPLYA